MIHIHSDIIKSKKIFVKVYSFPTLCSKLLEQANKRKEKQSDFSSFLLCRVTRKQNNNNKGFPGRRRQLGSSDNRA